MGLGVESGRQCMTFDTTGVLEVLRLFYVWGKNVSRNILGAFTMQSVSSYLVIALGPRKVPVR